MGPDPTAVQDIEAVKYDWPEWYVRVTTPGHIWHYGPWRTEWAARKLVHILRDRLAYEAREGIIK